MKLKLRVAVTDVKMPSLLPLEDVIKRIKANTGNKACKVERVKHLSSQTGQDSHWNWSSESKSIIESVCHEKSLKLICPCSFKYCQWCIVLLSQRWEMPPHICSRNGYRTSLRYKVNIQPLRDAEEGEAMKQNLLAGRSPKLKTKKAVNVFIHQQQKSDSKSWPFVHILLITIEKSEWVVTEIKPIITFNPHFAIKIFFIYILFTFSN